MGRREQSLIAHFTLLASAHRTHLRTVFRAAHEGCCPISKIAIFPYKSVIVAAFLAHDHHRQHGQDGLNSVQCGHLRGCGGSQLGGERSTVYARAACRRNGVGRGGTRPTRARGGGGNGGLGEGQGGAPRRAQGARGTHRSQVEVLPVDFWRCGFLRTTPRREHSPDTRSAQGEPHGGRRHRTPQFGQVSESALYSSTGTVPVAALHLRWHLAAALHRRRNQ